MTPHKYTKSDSTFTLSGFTPAFHDIRNFDVKPAGAMPMTFSNYKDVGNLATCEINIPDDHYIQDLVKTNKAKLSLFKFSFGSCLDITGDNDKKARIELYSTCVTMDVYPMYRLFWRVSRPETDFGYSYKIDDAMRCVEQRIYANPKI